MQPTGSSSSNSSNSHTMAAADQKLCQVGAHPHQKSQQMLVTYSTVGVSGTLTACCPHTMKQQLRTTPMSMQTAAACRQQQCRRLLQPAVVK